MPEPVEVHHENGLGRTLTRGRREGLKHVLSEQSPVGQAREIVVHRLTLELLPVGAALRDVTDEGEGQNPIAEHHLPVLDLHGKSGAIAAAAERLDRPAQRAPVRRQSGQVLPEERSLTTSTRGRAIGGTDSGRRIATASTGGSTITPVGGRNERSSRLRAPGSGQPRPDRGEEIAAVDRLGDVVVGPGVEAALTLPSDDLAGDGDDRK